MMKTLATMMVPMTRADLVEGAAAAEDVRKSVRQRDQKHVSDQRQRHFVIAERRSAKPFVNEPGRSPG